MIYFCVVEKFKIYFKMVETYIVERHCLVYGSLYRPICIHISVQRALPGVRLKALNCSGGLPTFLSREIYMPMR